MTAAFPGYDPEKFADFFRMGEEFAGLAGKFATAKLAPVDPQKIVDAQRRNMEALVDISRTAAKSYENLFRRQVEVLQDATRTAQEGLRELSAQGKVDPEASATVVREALEAVVRQLSALTTEAAKSNVEAFEALHRQVAESAEALTERQED